MATPQPIFCPQCHSSVRSDDRFCFNCGERLTVVEPAMAPPSFGARLTEEQLQVVRHPIGHHARVMAVAGSGKTTTMVHRIEHLLLEHRANPRSLVVLMYNALARGDFKRKLHHSTIPGHLVPSRVNTFHSYAYGFINQMMKQGLLPRFEMWTEDKEYLVHLTVLNAIRNLRLQNDIDPSEAEQAIGLWKGSLIPPERAGYRGHPRMPEVYQEFEKLRSLKRGLTFDDFVPTAVTLLEANQEIASQWCNQADFVVVDEYQDVNYGQQRLLELVAGQRADVMVVGDDDQTIYEWRGARPNYIIREFQQVFTNKPHVDYRLSRSFRFGPLLAQSAQNVIAFNSNRVPKRLVAHDLSIPSQVVVFTDRSNQAGDVDRDLADQVDHLLNQDGVEASNIAVLARMFVQLSGLETQFLTRKIPYHILGASPFFERREVRALLDYVRVALQIDEPMSAEHQERLLGIANTPSRMLTRAILDGHCQQALGNLSTRDVLRYLADPVESPYNASQREQVDGLLVVLLRTQERITEQPNLTAGDLLEWIAKTVNYGSHFDDYYGEGEDAADRKFAVASLIAYAKNTRLMPREFLEHVAKQDPTQGEPKERQVLLTSIFKTKGMEYDYVLMPRCEEGYLPCLFSRDVAVYDTAGIVREPEPSESIENERRLFYVGVTRARKVAFLGASTRPSMGYLQKDAKPSRFLEEMQLQSIVDILSPIQRVVSGDQSARGDILSGTRRWAGRRWVKQSLVDNYLASLGDNRLTGDIASILGAVIEEPFAYGQPYDAARSLPTSSGADDQRHKPKPHTISHAQSPAAPQPDPVISSANGKPQRRSWLSFGRRDG